MDYNLDDFINYYKNDPLYILLINEMFYNIRTSYNNLDNETKIILNYFIIENNEFDNELATIALEKLKEKYFNNYS